MEKIKIAAKDTIMENSHNGIILASYEDIQNMIITAVHQALKKYDFANGQEVDSKKKYLTSKDVELEYGFTQKMLSYWRLEGMGPPYSVHGKRVFYERAALDEYIEKHSLTPTRVPH